MDEKRAVKAENKDYSYIVWWDYIKIAAVCLWAFKKKTINKVDLVWIVSTCYSIESKNSSVTSYIIC